MPLGYKMQKIDYHGLFTLHGWVMRGLVERALTPPTHFTFDSLKQTSTFVVIYFYALMFQIRFFLLSPTVLHLKCKGVKINVTANINTGWVHSSACLSVHSFQGTFWSPVVKILMRFWGLSGEINLIFVLALLCTVSWPYRRHSVLNQSILPPPVEFCDSAASAFGYVLASFLLSFPQNTIKHPQPLIQLQMKSFG